MHLLLVSKGMHGPLSPLMKVMKCASTKMSKVPFQNSLMITYHEQHHIYHIRLDHWKIFVHRYFLKKNPNKQLTFSTKDDHTCEANISKLVQAVKGSSLLPATVPDNRRLVNVFTNKSADIQQTIDLLSFRKTGSTEMSAFIKSRVIGIPSTNAPLRRKNLKVFKGTKTKQIKKSKKSEKDKKNFISLLAKNNCQLQKEGY